ncbi:serine/threonine kinase [Aureococcus anophagefferens]|nr:serine/threonine kinase [Aureococcus anophagefferens]
MVVSDGLVFADEVHLVTLFEAGHGLGDAERDAALAALGWTPAEPNYGLLLRLVLADGVVDASEIGVVEAYEAQHGVTAKERTRTLAGLGWTVDKCLENAPLASTSAAPDAERQTLLLQCSRSVRMRIARSHAVRVDMRAVGLATGGFDESRRVGSGGFGAVYGRGAARRSAGAAEPRCPPGTLEQFGDVAIKRHLRGAGQGDAEFVKELDVLAQLRDPRLVHLLAYAADEHERVLVLELMRGGSLQDRLACAGFDGRDVAPLPWNHRLRIALDTSAALYYLHAQPRANDVAFIHGDVKSANVLLDDAGHAKLADFGLARKVATPRGADRTLTLAGSHGYMDPHYVYAFGVVLMELVTGLDARGLVDRVMAAERETDIFDAKLEPSPEALERAVDVLEIAHRCVQPAPGDRPAMDAVCDLLSEAELAGDAVIVDAEPAADGADVVGAQMVEVLSEVKLGNANVEQKLIGHLEQHELVNDASMSFLRMGLKLLVFRRRAAEANFYVHDVRKSFVSTGGLIRGACGVALTASRGRVVEASRVRLAFVCCQLPASEGKCAERNAAVKKITTKLKATILEPTRHCFILGDLNYRLDPNKYGAPAVYGGANAATVFHRVSQLIEEGNYAALGALDELTCQPQADRDEAGLAGFRTTPYSGPPSFKCVVGKKGFHYQHKRLPSFTDRILFRYPDAGPQTRPTNFEVVGDVSTSDHKPIRAAFDI